MRNDIRYGTMRYTMFGRAAMKYKMHFALFATLN